MHRFLWMVLRSVCSPRKKQKVEMQMARQTREITMPTQVMTDSSSSLMRPWYWGRQGTQHPWPRRWPGSLWAQPGTSGKQGPRSRAPPVLPIRPSAPLGHLPGPRPSPGGMLPSSCPGRLVER